MFLFRQEPDSEACVSTVGDVLPSVASEPKTVSPTCTSTEDEIISNQRSGEIISDQVSVSVPDVLETLLPTAEKDMADTLSSEPVFASAGVKPRLEVKNDLSSMFKSLSAKMKMKQQRQSRFSDIATVSESGLQSSDADAVVAGASRVPVGTNAITESNHLIFTSADTGPSASRTEVNTVCDDTSSSSELPFGHLMSLSVGIHNEASTVRLQNYDMHKVTSTGPLLSGTEHISSLPVFPPAVSDSTQNSSRILMTYNAPGIVSSQLGL